MNDELTEATRLFHKFCSKSMTIFRRASDFNMDSVYRLVELIDPEPVSGTVSRFDNSFAIVDELYGHYLKSEKGRVVVFPDLGWDAKPPFICAANKLLERVEEGVTTKRFDEQKCWKLIDGCSDALFVFETSGNILFFDHHEGYIIGQPKYK